MNKLIYNAVRCLHGCGILESKHVHDFKQCKHGVMIDGGLEYARRGWPDGKSTDHYEELARYEEEPKKSQDDDDSDSLGAIVAGVGLVESLIGSSSDSSSSDSFSDDGGDFGGAGSSGDW